MSNNEASTPPIPEEFNIESIFMKGLSEGKDINAVVDELTGENFIVNMSNRMFIRGTDAGSMIFYNADGSPKGVRGFIGEEQMFLQLLATAQVQLYLSKIEVMKRDMRIEELEQKLNHALEQKGYEAGRLQGLEDGMQAARDQAVDPSAEMSPHIRKRIMEMTSPKIRKAITGDETICPTIEQLEAWIAKNPPDRNLL